MNTRAELKDYILRELGYPLIQVEITDDMQDDIINSTIKEFSEFAYDGELIEYIKVDCTGMGEYIINSKVESITRLSKGEGFFYGNSVRDGFVPDDYVNLVSSSTGDAISKVIQTSNTGAMMDKFFGNEINYNYNHNKRKLYVFENYTGPLLMEAYVQYIPDESGDDIFNHTWIKKMCTEQSRLRQSNITGKFESALVGGARINHEKMQQQAEQNIEILREELITKYSGAAPILIG